jgi:hypothetical protein
MRATTTSAIFLCILHAAGCVAAVGPGRGDDGDDDDEPDAATGDGGDGACVMKQTMNIASEADVPDGCWDAGTLTVSSADLDDLDDLGDLRSVEHLTLNGNTNLTGNRTRGSIEVTGRLVITGNPRLDELDGFSFGALTEVRIENNERLTLVELDQVDVIGAITITGNQRLSQITLSDTLEDVTIRANPQLVNLISAAILIDGNLTIDDNDTLPQLNMPLLRRIEGALAITGNQSLDNFDPLWQATKIGSATIQNATGNAGVDCLVQEIAHCVPNLNFTYTQVQGCCRCVGTTHE